jgi:hypothetical protein
MRRTWHLPLLCAVLAAAAPVIAVAETPDEDLRTNRFLVARWRSNREHYARLKRDYKAFLELPPEKRDRLRELDRDLRDEDANTQARLARVLNRYMTWLDRLSEEDRARVDAAVDGVERLRIVKELREREWIAHLPRVDQERIRAVTGDQRSKLIADLRQEERNRRKEWQAAMLNVEEPVGRPNKPSHVYEFPPETQLYVNRILNPMLNGGDRERLKSADGKWPDLARTILELSEAHNKPVRFPPAAGLVPLKPGDYKSGEIPEPIAKLIFFDMRKERRDEFSRADREAARKLRGAIGRWPEFALAVHDVAKEKKIPLTKPLGPCTLEDFHKSVRDFYFDKMAPALKNHEDELAQLQKASGAWPEYPMLFMELAQKHKLVVPGTFLGGPRELWKAAREEQP